MRHIFFAVTVILCSSRDNLAVADGDPRALRAELEKSVNDAEHSSYQAASQEPANPGVTAPPTLDKRLQGQPEEPRDIISGLLDQVEMLKDKIIVTKRNALNSSGPRLGSHVGSSSIYPFEEGKIYEVHCAIDKITDIALEPGETLTNSPLAGDTVRWTIGLLSSGSPKGDITHLIVKPFDVGLETNLVVTTNKRVYHIKLLSGDWYMPSVSWNYPQEEALEASINARRKMQEESLSLPPERLNFGYEIKGRKFPWKPEIAFDDGNKSYIRMPAATETSEAPALFIIDDEGESLLVNYRVKGQFYIIDRLFDRAELKVGIQDSVTIYSSRYHRSFWEKIFS